MGFATVDTKVLSATVFTATQTGRLRRAQPISSARGEELKVVDGFVALPGGGFVEDADVARVRTPVVPRFVKTKEKWLAVDIDEQIFMAFEGRNLVKVGLCSGGENTGSRPGEEHARWSGPLQTVKIQEGALRVEELQWVMYYNQDSHNAIHPANWRNAVNMLHKRGCVNLPFSQQTTI